MKIQLGTNRRPRGGFTLVELLVVIGIIALLFSIATPIVITARRNAARVRMQADLNTISMGLEQYKKDFRDYPRPDLAVNPSYPVLAWALVGPWQAQKAGNNPPDGADGPGFRLQWTPGTGGGSGVGGRVWGPYVPPDKFPVEIVDQAPVSYAYLLDSYGSRIEYFPKWRNYKIGSATTPGTPLFGVAGNGDPLSADVTNGTGQGVYDCRQASSNPNAKEAVYYLQRALGDGMIRPGNPPTYPHNDVIDNGPEHALTTDPPPFILFSHGYQGKSFSPQDEVDKDFTKVPEVSNLPQP